VAAQSELFQVKPNSSSVGGPLNMPENPGIIVYFIKLELVDYQERLLSENFYWWSTLQSEYQPLQSLSNVELETSVWVTKEGSEYVFKANLQNPSPGAVALFIQLKLLKDDRIHEKDLRVLPTFYADNYFSLLPGEEKSVVVRCAQVDAGAYEPNLYLDGWNIVPTPIPKVRSVGS
jgi:mannosylglycoprotein endo-beta-mannosidase